MKTKTIEFLIQFAATFLILGGGLFSYIQANYSDKEDIGFMFKSIMKDLKLIEKDVTLLRKIQCSAIHKDHEELWEVNCQ